MRKLQLWTLVILTLTVKLTVFAQENLTVQTSVKSKKLSATKNISIQLPKSYFRADAQKTKYPVLYFLDAGFTDSHINAEIEALSSMGIIPQMIIVGIKRDGKNRFRDYTPTKNENDKGGGADNFIHFIEHELIPYIDKNYRTADFKILQGHSLGGLFSLYTFQANPELFDAHFAFSPSLQRADISTTLSIQKYINSKDIKQKYLYANMGSEGTDIITTTGITMQERFNAINRILDSDYRRPFRYKFEIFEEDPHHVTQFTGMRRALRDLFKGWFYAHSRFALGVNELKAHHKQMSERFGFDATPVHGGLLYWGGLANTRMFNNRKNALDFFKYDVELFPNSIDALENLADFYNEDGELDKAIPLIEKAITLVVKGDDKHLDLTKKLKQFKQANKTPAPRN